MGDVVRHLLQALHQRRDAVEHPVEGQGQAVEVVVGATHRHAAGEIAVDDRLGRAGNRRQPTVYAPAQAIAARRPQHDHPEEGAGKAAQQGAVQRLDTFLLVADQQAVAVRQHHGQHADRFALASAAVAPQHRPARRGQTTGQPPRQRLARRPLDAVVDGAGRAVALPYRLDDAMQTLRPVLLDHRRGLRADAGVELVRKGPADGQERDRA